MSIEVTQFEYCYSTSDKEKHRQELFNWLSANGSPFFDSVENLYNSDKDVGWIKMTCNNAASLILSPSEMSGVSFNGSGNAPKVLFSNGYGLFRPLAIDVDFVDTYSKAVKTNYGLYLCNYNQYADIIITKNNLNHTCVIAPSDNQYYMASDAKSSDIQYGIEYFTADMLSDIAIQKNIPLHIHSTKVKQLMNDARFLLTTYSSAPATVLTPFLCANGSYTENAFVSYCTQASALEHKEVSIDGAPYWTNGLFYLKG